MGCFQNSSSSSFSSTPTKTPEQKKAEWIKYLNECHDFRHAQLEKVAKEKYQDSEHGANYEYDTGFASYWKRWARFDNLDNSEKLPWVAFSEIVDDLSCPSKALDYVGPINSLIFNLEIISGNYTTDEDGEPKLIERAVSIEDVVDAEKNPLLKFITTFNCFQYANDSVGSIIVLLFIRIVFSVQLFIRNKQYIIMHIFATVIKL